MDGKKEFWRVSVLPILFLSAVFILTMKLFSLQVLQGEAYYALSMAGASSREAVAAARGQLSDRNGKVLVGNQVRYEVYLSPSLLDEAGYESLLFLLDLFSEAGLSHGDSLPVTKKAPYLYTELSSDEKHRRFSDYLEAIDLAEPKRGEDLLLALSDYYQLPEHLSLQRQRDLLGVLYELHLRRSEVIFTEYCFGSFSDTALLTAIDEAALSAVQVRTTAARRYDTSAAAHILGRVGLMNEAEWAQYRTQGYRMNDYVGKDGAEQAFEAYLHGRDGVLLQDFDKEGHVQQAGYETLPQPGNTVLLTLDAGLQEKTEAILAEAMATQFPNGEGAAVSILSVKDGGVLTLASYPSYDLSTFSEDYEALAADPLQPLYNRGLQGTYAPGSVFKMVTAAAALDTGLISPDTQILDTGRYDYYTSPQPRCWLFREAGQTHGLLTVSEAIAVSCNVFFYDVGRRLGIDTLGAYAARLGLGSATGIELLGESAGVISSPAYTEGLGEAWQEGNVLSAAIGQENNRFTPLQLAHYTATLVSGKRQQVHLLHEVRTDDDSETIFRYTPQVLETVSLAPSALEAIKAGMLSVTQSGSVSSCFQGLSVDAGAKTGSVQVAGSEFSNAVFVCFAPYDEPEIAIAIIVEKGGSGSELGGIAAEILAYYFGEAAAFSQEWSATEGSALGEMAENSAESEIY